MTELADALVAVDAGVSPIVVPEVMRTPPASGTAMSYRTQETFTTVRRRWLVLAGLCVGAGLSAAALLLTTDEPAPEVRELPAPLPVVRPFQPTLPLPLPTQVRDTAPAPSAVIVVHLDTGSVAANIFDESNALLGNSSSPDGLSLTRAEVERQLILRAAGHEELRVKIIPNRNFTMAAPMTAIRYRAPRPDVAPKPISDPRPDTRPDPPPDLPDPPPSPEPRTDHEPVETTPAPPEPTPPEPEVKPPGTVDSPPVKPRKND